MTIEEKKQAINALKNELSDEMNGTLVNTFISVDPAPRMLNIWSVAKLLFAYLKYGALRLFVRRDGF